MGFLANRRRHVLVSFGLSLAALLAQQGIAPDEVQIHSELYTPKTESTFHAEARDVELGVVVRDNKGKPVAGLDRNDFEVYDSGKIQKITSFSVLNNPGVARATANTSGGESKHGALEQRPAIPAAAPPPRYIVLLFDDINQDNGSLGDDPIHAMDAGIEFVKNGIAPGDRVAVFSMSGGPLSPFTSDAAVLIAAMKKLRVHFMTPPRDPSGACPDMMPYEAYLIDNHKGTAAPGCRPPISSNIVAMPG